MIFRKYYPVKTICMHGRALSVFDNWDLWEKYNYKDFDIIAEPYLDVNYDEVLYLSDTSQCWNGGKANLRDKVNSNYNFNFKTTYDTLNNLQILPDKILFTFHPDRWASNEYERLYLQVLIWFRNTAKILYFNRRANKYKIHNDNKITDK